MKIKKSIDGYWNALKYSAKIKILSGGNVWETPQRVW